MNLAKTILPEQLRNPSPPIWSLGHGPNQYSPILLFCAITAAFAGVALFIGLPGADGNACETYNVITRLSQTLTYTLSRTPGQPVLDYCNYVSRSLGGSLALQAWFVLVSSLGITALYVLLRDLQGHAPLIGALALALNPLFVTHVGGVGDFAVSLSLLIISLMLAVRRKVFLAGAILALAVGCRLVFCIFVFPASVLLGLTLYKSGASRRQCLIAVAQMTATTTLLSGIEYAPSLSFWGRSLFQNLPFQGIRYHISAFLFKLFISMGAPVWLLIGSLCVILVIQSCASRRWAVALILASLSAGIVLLSPYYRTRDRYAWHFEKGWYWQNYLAAYDNQSHLESVRSGLSTLPPKTLLITSMHWTIEHEEHSDLQTVARFPTAAPGMLKSFTGVRNERFIVSFQEPQLRTLLENVTRNVPANERLAVVYDADCFGLLRRWAKFDPGQYGRPVDLPRAVP
jgi:hypothetical protein